jgi:chromosome segregation ATPase
LVINLYNDHIEFTLTELSDGNNYTSKQGINELLTFSIYKMFETLEEIYTSILDSLNIRDFSLTKLESGYELSLFSEYKRKLLKADIMLNLISVYDINFLTQKIYTLSFDNESQEEKIKELSQKNEELSHEIECLRNEIEIVKTNYHDMKNELKDTRDDFVEAIEKLQELNKTFFMKQEDVGSKLENICEKLNIKNL